jgi:hypothetical protein
MNAYAAVTRSIDDLIRGNNTDMELFSTFDDADGGTYVYNPSCWAAGIDLSAVHVWNDNPPYPGGAYRCCTLISPRHVLAAYHFTYGVPVGTTIRFARKDGTVTHSTVAAVFRIGETDLNLFELSDEIVGIEPMKVLPRNFRQYMADIELSLPCIGTNQYHRISIKDLYAIPGIPPPRSPTAAWFNVPLPHVPDWTPWSEHQISGDSGSPIMMVFGSVPVLVAITTTGNSVGSGPGPSSIWDAIEAVMDGEKLSEFDIPYALVHAFHDTATLEESYEDKSELNIRKVPGYDLYTRRFKVPDADFDLLKPDAGDTHSVETDQIVQSVVAEPFRGAVNEFMVVTYRKDIASGCTI